MLHGFDALLQLQSAFARAVGHRLDDPMIEVAVAVEHHLRDALLRRLLRGGLPHQFGEGDLALDGPELLAEVRERSDTESSVLPEASSMIWA